MTDRWKREPTRRGRRALQVTVLLDGRPLLTRVAEPRGDLLPDVPMSVRLRGAGEAFLVDTVDGPVQVPTSGSASVRHGRLEAELSEVRVSRSPRFSWLQGDLVLPVLMLATTLFALQMALLFSLFAAAAASGASPEPTPEYLARLLREQFDGAERGVIARSVERPRTGDPIESFYLQPGHTGPVDRMGGGQNVGSEIRDGDVRPRKVVAEEQAPEKVVVAGQGEDPPDDDIPPATPADEEEGEDQPIAVHVTEGWGLTDWYDTQDARDDQELIQRQLQAAHELLRLDPDDPNGLAIRAYYEYLAMDFGAARRTYERFTGLFPDDPAGWNNLALVYKREGRFTDEEALYRVALGLSPEDDHALNNLAVCLAHQGRYDEALAIMQKLEVLTPQDAYADLHRAKIYAAMGKEDRSYHFLQKSLSGMRKLDTLHNIEFRQDIRVDPAFVKMREQKRFRDLLSKYYGDQPAGWWQKLRSPR